MTKRQYVFREGARVGGVKPEIAAKELQRLQKAGAITAPAVVEAARPDDAPLHPVFEWDDEAAADEYRLEQARRLIRAVQVIENDQPPRSIFVHVQPLTGRDGNYQQLDTLIHSPDAYVMALAAARRRVASAREAVAELHRVAEGVKPSDYIARIALAAQALATAEQAVRALH